MYRVLVNNVKDCATFMIDTQGYITSWNAGAFILKQDKSEETIGQNFSIFIAMKTWLRKNHRGHWKHAYESAKWRMRDGDMKKMA